MFELRLPKMGESISEATIISWLKAVGDFVEAEETILEVATDKVDSDVPSPVSGVIKELRFGKGDVVKVGEVLAIIEPSEGRQSSVVSHQVESVQLTAGSSQPSVSHQSSVISSQSSNKGQPATDNRQPTTDNRQAAENRKPSTVNQDIFLSPLIISIAQKENLSLEEVQAIPGTGTDGRIRKRDVFNYLKNRKYPIKSIPNTQNPKPTTFPKPNITFNEKTDRIVEMDRMRQMIAGHMVYSKQTSPHVTSYLEVDVTNLVNWRNANKDAFQEKRGQKLTFTPVFVQAVARAVAEFPMINVQVDGNKIVVKGDVNIGMATALPSGNLIVPVVRNADRKEMHDLAADVNRLADAARNNKLKPDDIQGSTFTISNVGTFGSLMGTPIINQPEVAILAFGIIKKRPEVITTDKGDEIAIRSMMFLSLSFDHRVVDGHLGGSFLRRVGDHLEKFDINTAI